MVVSCSEARSQNIVTRSMTGTNKLQTVQNEELTRKCIKWESDVGRYEVKWTINLEFNNKTIRRLMIYFLWQQMEILGIRKIALTFVNISSMSFLYILNTNLSSTLIHFTIIIWTYKHEHIHTSGI
jgi:hypothetical protein